MGKPLTLLERICEHALSFESQSLLIERKEGHEWVYMRLDGSDIKIAKFASSGRDASELRENLHEAATKPKRTILAGGGYLPWAQPFDSAGEDAFEVLIDVAPKPDPSAAPSFTARQGQYLAYIYNYTKIHRQAPAASDLERHFRVSPPSIHEMIKTLQRNGLIERTPGKARSIRLLVRPEHLPRLE